MDDVVKLQAEYEALAPWLNEWSRRRWAAAKARALGRGGPTTVMRATGISLPTIRRGLRELGNDVQPPPGHQRQAGGGRTPAAADPDLLRNLNALLSPVTRGDPESPLLWT